jgi:hypothetical protein
VGDAFQGSELGELYYTELGSQAGSTILRTHDADAALFHNFQPYLYWSGTHTEHNQNGNGHSTFSLESGFQGANTDNNEMYVIPVFDGTRTVTNNRDDGSIGSLRSVIDAAHAGDTVVFSPQLAGQTITLQSPIRIYEDDEAAYKILDIQGPGADRLAISGNNTTGILTIVSNTLDPPATAVAGLASMTISGLTMENGRSGSGGAILDDGFSLTLSDDCFTLDQAGGGPGGDALGGAVAVLAGSISQQTLRILRCQFDSDVAIGTNGGTAEGGALSIDAGSSTKFSVVVTDSLFRNDAALGGDGVNGGAASGGAFFYTNGAAAAASVLIGDSAFVANTAQGGRGIGRGGLAAGGGLALASGTKAGGTLVTVTGSQIVLNTARAGDGSIGGSAFGGGVYLTSNGQSRSDTWIMQDDVVATNRAVSGNGGSADSFGGGVYDGFGGTLELLGVAIVANEADGGPGHGYGGGIAIAPGALAKADGHTSIHANDADIGPDVFGPLGMS